MCKAWRNKGTHNEPKLDCVKSIFIQILGFLFVLGLWLIQLYYIFFRFKDGKDIITNPLDTQQQ